MTRTGEEVKAKYKKQWTRAPARVSLYKTPCPPDLPPFRGCWRQPAAAAVFTPAVCRAMCGFAGIAPTLSPRRQLCAAPRYEGRFDQGERAGSSMSGRRDGFLRFPLAESHAAGLRGAIVRGSRQPTFAHQHSERTAVTHTALRLSSFGHFGRRRTKRCPPSWGTSLHRGYFLTACEEGSYRFYQGESMLPSSAAASSPQMGLMNFSVMPASSPDPSVMSSKDVPVRGLPKSRRSCISTSIVVTQGWIYCNFIMGSVIWQ